MACSNILPYSGTLPGTGTLSPADEQRACVEYRTWHNTVYVPWLQENAPTLCAAADLSNLVLYKGEWGDTGTPTTLNKGESVSIGNVYYVSKIDNNTDTPPSTNYITAPAPYSKAETDAKILTVKSFRNLIINGDQTINTKRVTDWDSVAVGDYGFDRWKKRSDTHIEQIIEDGMYEYDTEYVLSGNGVTQTVLMSPSSGHWTVGVNDEIPNTATNVQLELGTSPSSFEDRHESVESVLCAQYYREIGGYTFEYSGSASYHGFTVSLSPAMRAVPTVTATQSISYKLIRRESVSVLTSSTGSMTLYLDAEL